MLDHDDDTPSGGYWPSVTDLFVTLFIIAIVMLGVVFYVLLPKNNVPALKQVQIAVGQDFRHVLEPMNKLRLEMAMKPVKYRGAKQVIRDLAITNDAAISLIREFKKNEPSGMSSRIKELESQVKMLQEELIQYKQRVKDLLELVEKLEEKKPKSIENLIRENQALQTENRLLKKESLTFIIDERRREFRFDSGSPLVTPDFSKALRDSDQQRSAPFPDFAQKIIENPERFNTLEIIGHTDGVPISSSGNLDQRLPELLSGKFDTSRALNAGSNNDLGLLRALSLKQEWLNYCSSYLPQEKRQVLQNVRIRCYSAGQTILPVAINDPKPEDFRKNDPRARRIEMRLTRLGDFRAEENPNASVDDH